MDKLKAIFSETFSLLAWVSLLGYVWYCTANGIETDSVRDAWNIMILIAGYYFGSRSKQAEQKTTTETTPSGETKTTVEPIIK